MDSLKKQDAVVVNDSSLPVPFNPIETKKRNSEADAVIEHAQRIQDWPMLKHAIQAKIDELSAFVDWWDLQIGSEGRPKKTSRVRGQLLQPELEQQTGIKHQQVSRWKKKKRDPEKWAIDIEAAAAKRAFSAGANTTAAEWTGDPESYTPAKYVEAARGVMGAIDLDPASDAFAQEVVRATRWYSVNENGLNQNWTGRVFLNPPYSYPTIQEFIDKLIESLAADSVTQAILLTNNNTDTRWWQRSAQLATGVCFTAGRINFYKPDGSVSQPTNGQTFFYFGANRAEFLSFFSEFGFVMERAE